MKKYLFLTLLAPFVLFANNSESQDFCLEKYPNDSSRFLKCVENRKIYNQNIPKYQKQKTYNGWYLGNVPSRNSPIPSAHVINDPVTNQCSIYYKNRVKQNPYKGQNLGRYNRIVCGGETLDDAVNYCMRMCEGKITKAQAQNSVTEAQFVKYLNEKKKICRLYGFTDENAVAGCVQQEINNDLAKYEQQKAYASNQARANATQRNNALSNMGRCLSTEGNFAACGNAWNGYTPKPAKKVYKCDYDVFGNQISSTCREQ
ncbi:hypothetical protein N9367_03155 [Gammaproteobacteria bacterium]|nr:hypothetical protein [Gammaproteobacteria bacterium]